MQDNTKAPLSSTFRQTEGGRTGPYKASAFDLTPCSDLPSLDAVGDVSRASEILNAYLVRVGANGTCLSDPNFQGLCNPPLSAATEYRWVWAAAGEWQVCSTPTREDPKLVKCVRPHVLRAYYVPGPSWVP